MRKRKKSNNGWAGDYLASGMLTADRLQAFCVGSSEDTGDPWLQQCCACPEHAQWWIIEPKCNTIREVSPQLTLYRDSDGGDGVSEGEVLEGPTLLYAQGGELSKHFSDAYASFSEKSHPEKKDWVSACFTFAGIGLEPDTEVPSETGTYLIRGGVSCAAGVSVVTDSDLQEGSVSLSSGGGLFFSESRGEPASSALTDLEINPPKDMKGPRTFYLGATNGGLHTLSYALLDPDYTVCCATNISVEVVLAKLFTNAYYVAYGSADPLEVGLTPESHDPGGYTLYIDGTMYHYRALPPFQVFVSGLSAGEHTLTATPYTFPDLAVSATITVIKVDLCGDTNRDGDIDENDEDGKDACTVTRGILISPPLRTLEDSGNDITGLSTITINAKPTAPVPGLTLKIKKSYEPPGCTLHILTANGEKWPDFGLGQSHTIDPWPADTLTLAVMPQYARPRTTLNWPIRFDLELQAVDASGNVLFSDTIRLTVAPMILPPECNTPQKIYTRASELSGLPGVTYISNDTLFPWAQDMVKLVKHQIASGQTGDLFVDLDHEGKGNFPDKLRDDEDLYGGMIWTEIGGGAVSMGGDGGNVMATPPLPNALFGKLMIGSARSEEFNRPDPLPYWQGQGVQPTVRITTDWLMVGHVDEILMWVASDKVLYADPWKAADLLHQEIAAGHQTNSLWFGFDEDGKNKTIQEVVIATSGSDLKLTTLPAPGLSDSTSQATLVFSNSIFVAGDILRVDDEILKVIAFSGPTVTVARAQAKRLQATHATGSVIYAYTDVMKANLPVDPSGESVVKFMDAATNELRQALGTYASLVPMPVLFAMTQANKYSAASANVVNCLVGNNGTVYYSKTGCQIFEDYISTFVSNVQPVDTWSLHIKGGDIHCATTAQRQLNLTTPWWLQIINWE